MSNTTMLTFRDATSNKFYEIAVDDCSVAVRYGAQGARGVSQPAKAFSSREEAQAHADKLRLEKTRKGYVVAVGEPTATAVAVGEKRRAHDAGISRAIPESAVAPKKAVVAASTAPGGATSEVAARTVTCLSYTDGESSDKFYEVAVDGCSVTIRYGRRGTCGITSDPKVFPLASDALAFASKTLAQKRKSGYADGDDGSTPSTRPGTTLPVDHGAPAPPAPVAPFVFGAGHMEIGQIVEIQGSAALPYRIKRVDDRVYSCNCPGWTMNIKKRGGVEHSTCKHIREAIGDAAEDARLAGNAGTDVAAEGEPHGPAAAARGAVAAAAGGDTNASIVKKVSLAQTWTDRIDPTGWIMSEKLDGMRAYWSAGHLWSRAGNLIYAPAWFTAALPADLELDGELFMGRGKFQQCVSITRRGNADQEWHQITYVIFDAPTAGGGIENRLAAARAALEATAASLPAISSAVSAAPCAPSAHIHPHVRCEGPEHLVAEAARIKALGGEGVMLRKATALHRGGRTADLLKVKEFQDDEALVVGHEEGAGRLAGLLGALVCRLRSGRSFKVGSGFSDAERAFSRAPPVGSVITFKFFELTEDGIPRFPTFLRIRPDVAPSEFSEI